MANADTRISIAYELPKADIILNPNNGGIQFLNNPEYTNTELRHPQ